MHFKGEDIMYRKTKHISLRRMLVTLSMGATIFLLVMGTCYSIENPVDKVCWEYYRYNGNNYQITQNVTVVDSYWDQLNTGWDSCVTNSANKYNHAHFGVVFPRTDPNTGIEVTYAMIDDYYTTVMYPESAGYTKSGSTTSDWNCWGYCFGKYNWVDQWGIIAADEYQMATTANATVASSPLHGIKVLECYPCGHIKKTEEKYRSSAYYKKTWDPPGTTLPSFVLYRPK